MGQTLVAVAPPPLRALALRLHAPRYAALVCGVGRDAQPQAVHPLSRAVRLAKNRVLGDTLRAGHTSMGLTWSGALQVVEPNR